MHIGSGRGYYTAGKWRLPRRALQNKQKKNETAAQHEGLSYQEPTCVPTHPPA